MKIAYIMSRFPLLSETFILREMIEIERRGDDIFLFPLICQDQIVAHSEVKPWMERRYCIPYFNVQVLLSTLQAFFRNPFKFLRIFFQIFYWNLPSPKFLVRALVLFPKATLTAKIIMEENIDHIHAHYASHSGLMAYLIHQFTGISYSITMHSHDIYDNHVMLEQKLKASNFLVTISNYNVEYLCNLLGEWVRKKIHLIPCGVDPKEYKPKDNHKITNNQNFIVLQIGSLHWKKGQKYLLHAIKLISDDIKNIKLQIIGEGPERKNLQKLIDELELSAFVDLLGAKTQDEVKTLLPMADCYIQTSVSEGIPVSLMEALACGLPAISTDITGIPELVIQEQTGILIPPKNISAIAQAIEYIHDHPAQGKEFGLAGREHVINYFNLPKNVSTLANLFNKIIHAPSIQVE